MAEETCKTSLATEGHLTIGLFAQLLDQSREASSQALSNQQWLQYKIEHEKDRYELWASNLGLFATGYGSLDYRLREASGLWKTVELPLQSLNTALEDGENRPGDNIIANLMNIAITYCFEDQTEDHDEEFEDWEIVGKTLTQGSNPLDELLLDSIRDPINRLYRLSSRYQTLSTRAISETALQHTQIDPDTSVDWLEAIKLFDYDYIRTKIKQLTGSRLGMEEALSAPRAWLIDRLVNCNGERRKLFSYWRQHRLKLQHHADVVFKDSDYMKNDTASHTEQTSKLLPVAITLAISGTQLQQLPENFQAARPIAAISEYIPSVTPAAIERITFPPPPKRDVSDLKEFECPYCYTICPKAILNTHAWRVHLMHDLRPYMCTYEACTDTNQMYDRITDWIQHENLHRAIFSCPEHPDLIFRDEADLSKHWSTPHKTSKYQTAILTDQIGTSVSSRADRPCPICLCIMEKMEDLQQHVAQHLVELSLFSLPRILQEDTEDDKSDKAAVQDFGGMVEASRDGDFGSESLRSYGSRHSNPKSDILVDNDERQAIEEEISLALKEALNIYDVPELVPPADDDDKSAQKVQAIDDLSRESYERDGTILSKDTRNKIYDSLEVIHRDLLLAVTELLEFQQNIPSAHHEITALVFEIYEICDRLRDLQAVSTKTLSVSRVRFFMNVAQTEIAVVRKTFVDLAVHMQRRNKYPGRPKDVVAQMVWGDLQGFFYRQDKTTLLEWTKCFRQFLQEAVLILNDKPISRDFDLNKKKINSLHQIQAAAPMPIRGLQVNESINISDRRSRPGYHRTSVACVHCRRRKIRCLMALEDLEKRCTNCIRLRKECNFYPVDLFWSTPQG